MTGAGKAGGRHVLYVAWGFAPHRGPGVYRPLATVNLLVSRGYRVTVLAADLATFDVVIGGDRALLEDVDRSVRVVRVPMAPHVRDPIINRWPRKRVTDPVGWATEVLAAQMVVFPEEVYSTWQPRVEAVAYAVHERDPVDLVIATGNPYVDFTVPLRLHEDFGIPFVLDDRDSWVLDVYTGKERPDAHRVLPWLEFALAKTTRMWFVNPPIANWHRERFPEHAHKVKVVENGWDPRFLDISSIGSTERERGFLVYTYVGTVNSTLPVRLLAEGWRQARRRSPRLAGSELRIVGHFGHSGVLLPGHGEVLREFAAEGMVFEGRRPKHEVGASYASSDVLVFAKEGSGFVTSGKVYEYVATGLPIVSVLNADHDARRVLDGYPGWHDAAENTVEGLANAMLAALDEVHGDATRRAAALAHGARFRRDVVLAAALDDVEGALQA